MDKEGPKRLLEEFPPHSYEQWKEAAVALLKGRPFEKTLITSTYEGFDLEPIYMAETRDDFPHLGDLPGMGSKARGSRLEGYLQDGWKVSQELVAPTPGMLNERIHEGLEKGQNEINLWLDGPGRAGEDVSESGNAGVCGVSVVGSGDWAQILQGVHLEMVSLYVQAGAAAPVVYAELLAALRAAGQSTETLTGCVGWDPVGWLVESGQLPGKEEIVLDRMADWIRYAARETPRMSVVEVRGHDYQNGGASSAQELGAVLATAIYYLRELEKRGLKPSEVAPKMRLSVSVGGNFFLEIAKLRAARLLWNRVLEAWQVPAEARQMHLHARTGLYNKTLFDPYVNMLRTTAEAFAAVVGGCDSLHVGTFDEAVRESDALARRIARNTHPILAEECGLSRVMDPAGGSHAVETLTDQMAGEAWKQMQGIESAGGILAVLRSGHLQAELEATRQQKVKNLQRRKDVLVGTNQYPNSTEKLLESQPFDYGAGKRGRLAEAERLRGERDEAALKAARDGGSGMEALIKAAQAGASHGELFRQLDLGEAAAAVQPIRLRRGAEDFEKLRLAARALAEAGQPPTVHQLNMGPSRKYRMRADWTSAFFQVGGFTVLSTDDYDGIEDAVQACRAKGAAVAVITSDDETYAGTVEPLARELKKEIDGLTVLVAGAPGEHEPAWKEAGVDDFVHLRVNSYQFNRGLLESLGAKL